MSTPIVKFLNSLAESFGKRCSELRDAAPTKAAATKLCVKSYNQGAAVAYTEAANVVYRELGRLQNKLQNGSLTKADFDEAMGLL